MASDLTKAFAIYPMVEEHEATGRVAAVYSQILRSMPFVPSLFKSLAVCPGYLGVAWAQAAHAVADDAFSEAVAALVSAAVGAGSPPADAAVRDTLSQFVTPLSRMLLLSTGLLLAVEGHLTGTSANAESPPAGPVEPERRAASQWETDASWDIYGDIRATLQTPIVNSIWRVLAQRGQLESAWAQLRPQVARTRGDAEGLQRLADERARSVPWFVVADVASLEAAGVADALPGISVILDAYVKTLPRVLALAGPAGTD